MMKRSDAMILTSSHSVIDSIVSPPAQSNQPYKEKKPSPSHKKHNISKCYVSRQTLTDWSVISPLSIIHVHIAAFRSTHASSAEPLFYGVKLQI